LKNLLKDYPADISMFKEMIQNADDAGASKVHFVWDWRNHRRQSLLTPDMSKWQGPALWVFNDATFSSKDFDSICRLGVGGKRDASRKIGRFGLGFNSVYNYTDLPSILSDDVVLFLDPHVRHLQAMGASVQKPGIKLRFLKIDVLDKFRDQFEPYHNLLGCDLSGGQSFHGTLFRLPFRTDEAAKNSDICDIAVDRPTGETLNGLFKAECFQWLLFLQSVSMIELSEIPEGCVSGPPELRSLARVKLQEDVPAVLACNNFLTGPCDDLDRIQVDGGETKPEEAALEITNEKHIISEGAENQADMSKPQAGVVDVVSTSKDPPSASTRVSIMLKDGEPVLKDITIMMTLTSYGEPPQQRLHSYRLVAGNAQRVDEQVGIAVPLSKPTLETAVTTKEECIRLADEEGRLFCFLPLPKAAVSLRLPIHVHAPVNTTQDRRSVLLDERVGDHELIKMNMKLLDMHSRMSPALRA